MRKSLFAIGLLAVSYSVQAQILCHVDTNANMYVSEGTLVYSGGGIQTRDNGILDVHGNVMVVGTAGDAVRTISGAGAGSPKTTGGNIVLRLNDSGNYATSTYGQLYIDGLTQTDVTGIVSKEYRANKHGSGNFYQQVALPFKDKALGSLSTELAKTFVGTRRSQNEILKWNNATVVANHFAYPNTTTISDPTAYYMLGSKSDNLNLSAPPATLPTIAPTPTGSVFTIHGKPYSTLANVTLQNAGNGINFGIGGNAVNQYNEKYNTYLNDQWDITNGAWSGTYGKNIYEFGNPFLTNLDLSRIGYSENGGVTDGNEITNIWGVQYAPGVVQANSDGSTSFLGAKTMTYDVTTHVPTGDVNELIIKPMGSFIVKLRDNNSQTLNFNTLRRFNGATARDAGVDYSVTAARFGKANGTVKQLGVIALDAKGNEIGRTYYVVSPHATTGHQTSNATSIQAAAGTSNVVGTYEEALNGGYDENQTNSYWLYINEANEKNFEGKNIKLINYSADIKSYKFEIRENAKLVNDNTHELSSGIGFYYKGSDGKIAAAKQGSVIPVTGADYDLYYGEPKNNTLDIKPSALPSRTVVVYNPGITNYIVRFDPKWKKADIEVYDMSGKLVISKKAVNTSTDFVIELDNSIKSSYVVKIVSDNGETVNTKILLK